MSSQGLQICPQCGERLRRDWLRPVLITAGILAVIVLIVFAGPRGLQGFESLLPARAIRTVQAMVSDVPVLVDIPSLTPSLTPSITPSPTSTPTSTPVPTATPSPTLTPRPTATHTSTPTATPSATPTRTRRPATSTPPPPTPTAVSTIAAPDLLLPEDGSSYGAGAIIRLAWQSNHTLDSEECFLLTVSYVQGGSRVDLPMCLRTTQWWVDDGLYLQPDQETDRAYHWSVRVVRRQLDADEVVTYVPLGPASEEWTFYWH